MSYWLELIVSLTLLIGGFFVLVGSIGLARLPDFFTRLHAPTKATTLGIGAMLLGSIIVFTVRENSLTIHELVISLFLFITAPVSAHMMAKAALHHHLNVRENTKNQAHIRSAHRRQTPKQGEN